MIIEMIIFINHNNDHKCNDYIDALANSNLLARRASQFLNMKNWDNSTNYSILIARYF